MLAVVSRWFSFRRTYRAPVTSVTPARWVAVLVGSWIMFGVGSGEARCGTVRHDQDETALDTLAPVYDNVGEIFIRDWTGHRNFKGSGTLISPRWVLTAAHLLTSHHEGPLDPKDPCPELVSWPDPPDIVFVLNDREFVATEYAVPESFSSADCSASGDPLDCVPPGDIALIGLGELVPESVAQPARLYTSDPRGETGVYVGFGRSGTAATGCQKRTKGRRLVGRNRIDRFGGVDCPEELCIAHCGVPPRADKMLSDFDHPADTDRDGVGDDLDNCPDVHNPTQSDQDKDGTGDPCDPTHCNRDCICPEEPCAPPCDLDGDCVMNIDDNCSHTANPGQSDSDGDGVGDECDNCPQQSNPMQHNVDINKDGYPVGAGDACDDQTFARLFPPEPAGPQVRDPDTLEYCCCDGDSGGAVFIDPGAPGDDARLAGVIVGTAPRCKGPRYECYSKDDYRTMGTYGSLIGSTRVASYLDWVSTGKESIGYEMGVFWGAMVLEEASEVWNHDGDLYIGYDGTGQLHIRSGALLNTSDGEATVAREPGSSGEVTIEGAGSRWSHGGDLTIGGSGVTARVEVRDESALSASAILLGKEADGMLLATGGSTVECGQAWVGGGMDGILEMGSGTARVTLQGAATSFTVEGETGMLYVGLGSSAEITVAEGAELFCPMLLIGPGSPTPPASYRAEVSVDGPGSNLLLTGPGFVTGVSVGGPGTHLAISDHGVLSCDGASGGVSSGGSARVTEGGRLEGLLFLVVGGDLEQEASLYLDDTGTVQTGSLTVSHLGRLEGVHLRLTQDESLPGIQCPAVQMNSQSRITATTLEIGESVVLESSGVIAADVTNRGSLRPTAWDVSRLVVEGDLTLEASGSLVVQIPTGPGDQPALTVEGEARLDGNLHVDMLPGSSAALGTSFRIMTFARRVGEFQSTTGLELGSGRWLRPVYTDTHVDLVVVDSADSDPTITDAVGDRIPDGDGQDLGTDSVPGGVTAPQPADSDADNPTEDLESSPTSPAIEGRGGGGGASASGGFCGAGMVPVLAGALGMLFIAASRRYRD